jgi:SMP-30/Gluconolactonase/LRE-like region
MKTSRIVAIALGSILVVQTVAPAGAWDRGKVEIFAVLPPGSTGPEGLTVGPDGNVFVTTFGFNSQGSVTGNSELFVFRPNGSLLREVPIQNSTPHTLGLGFNPVTGDLIILDFGAGTALKVDPKTGHSSLFMTASTTGIPDPNTPGTDPTMSGLNALTFDSHGNVYISDSFQGIIWKTGPAGGTGPQRLGTIWVQDAGLTTTGIPPFGANGIQFNNAGTTVFVANTGNDQIIQIPVNLNGSAGKPAVFVNSINGADGIIIDKNDNIWAAANQADEIVVIDQTGKVIAKLGDFNGVDDDGVPHGLLFPASPAFSLDGKTLYVTNLALDLTLFGLTQAVDSQWAHQVKHYTVAQLRAKIPRLPDGDDDHQ